ncbi:MAG: hypothetical protein AUJ92_18815 [Armatimonadetes bacterium CG2_30_59_28]|nr:carbon-nitrogen hydrolase family protein [Armatimonadota bacterium]OIO90431.1 MAG: hypothetical protein AUJ92_18815 [Armatimonadetes bacterium CG2_30_59_28]PIU66135.1 MAG: hypothetical protein COS85_06000 [Armatimonadetes bacterium CG07_land_8_20_14_0_80_59_28]PIX41566.1 MAG: hypothetical protein COZ56_11630 [Armatimonadetes bacterium CG_4_8_14_3_um_filter_58_9]PIY41628.1 MAG: hypothetical protein COZ05_15405 [Armatimonadetes bacterium CG_4_10_14_3_um_filter_59_10]PJB74590.1 MAG: hypothetic
MRISNGVYPQQQLLEQRSRDAKARIKASLGERDARPAVVGVCQLRNHCQGIEGKQSNLRRMLHSMEWAAAQGVQVIVFPEMFLPGYFVAKHGSPEEAAAAAHELADVVGESTFLRELRNAARRHTMVAYFGFCERSGEHYYNAAGLIDADGVWLGVRRKNPLTAGAYDQIPFTESPTSKRSVVFDTRYARVGLLICFDGEFPESVRQMRLERAELLLWCNAGTGAAKTGSSARFNQCGSYAQTNRMYVASVNTVGAPFYGNSCIYAPWGEPLVQLSHDEETLGIATINLSLCCDWPLWRDRLAPSILRGRCGG